MRLRSVILIVAVALAAGAGCSNRPNERIGKVSGEYTGRFSDGTETLVLREDGTYEERFEFVDKRVVSNHGTWTEDRTTNLVRVRVNGGIVWPTSTNGRTLDWEFNAVPVPGGIRLELEKDPDGAIVLDKAAS